MSTWISHGTFWYFFSIITALMHCGNTVVNYQERTDWLFLCWREVHLEGAVKVRWLGLCAGIQVFSASEWAMAPRVLGRAALVRLCRQQSLEHTSHCPPSRIRLKMEELRGRTKREREKTRRLFFIHPFTRQKSIKLCHASETSSQSHLSADRQALWFQTFLWCFLKA